MIRHFPANRNIRRQKQPWKQKQQKQEEEQEQSKPKEKGWYCITHEIKYLCELCGQDNIYGKREESKYYFVDGVRDIIESKK